MAEAVRYAAGISYQGSAFKGWQRQTGLPTVQGEIEAALSRIADHPITIQAAGRTDAGVHASGQVIAFSSTAARDLHTWQRGGNGLTSDEIHMDWICVTPTEFHPRYSAVSRRYLYVFQDRRHDPFLTHAVWQTAELNPDQMHRQAQALLGEHDFSSFRGAGCQSLTPMRRLNHCRVYRHGAFVLLDIEANAFLLHMVRNIAAALAAHGRSQASLDAAALLRARDRTLAPATAPANGLYLTHVHYPGADFPAGKIPAFLTHS
ncbi:MAG: tRNA pseudouridine(38-40) synthase TruA [Pseudomonadota bacterium]